ncbi:MAG: efflux transporter, RND family, MFP subunit [uncultured bacterium]|nr:MAG: efflux transporter, RND family, MFP subunit [uncultured bacterium]
MKKKSIALLLALGVVAGGFYLVDEKQKNIAALPKPQPVIPVIQVAAVTEGSLEVTAHYLGVIEPVSKTDLSSRITAAILAINKREGDPVYRGEELVVLDDRELHQRYNSVRAEMLATRQKQVGASSALLTQKSIHERDRKLFAAGAISREALDRSKAAFDGAGSIVAAYEESIRGLAMNTAAAGTQAGYARILAPFTGILTRRLLEPGDMAAPGKPILTVEDTSSYKVTVEIPQEELAEIKKGAKLYLQNGNEVIAAAVTRLYPALGKNRLASVETVLPSAPFQLPSGSSVGVDLVKRAVTGLILPENGLVKNEKGYFVCAVKEGVVSLRPVQLLGSGKGRTAVQGDLAVGEECAVGQENRLLTLTEGREVTVVAGGAR